MKKNQGKFNILSSINASLRNKILTCFILSSMVILSFLIVNKVIDQRKSLLNYTITNDIRLINKVEDVNIHNDNIILSGYAFILDQDTSNNNISVILRNVNTMKEVWLSIEQNDRPDVNSYFESEFDYEKSGFTASASIEKVKQDEVYEVILSIDSADTAEQSKTRTTVSAKQYLFNHKLYNYNPNDFDQPDLNVESEMLREVFLNGQLCYYQKDIDMYIYQYQNKLFWIANSNFNFNKNGLTYIPVQIFTTRADKLPEERILQEYDKLNFYFEQEEYTDQATKPYRVVIQDIPQEYPITYIKTGVYDSNDKAWIWSVSFHLKKSFK